MSTEAFHNLALTVHGEVVTWGTNDFGQLGNGSTLYHVVPRKVLDLDHVFVVQVCEYTSPGQPSLISIASINRKVHFT